MNDIRVIRGNEIEQGELWEEKRVEHMWFHVVRGLIMKGEIAKIGAVPWAVYTVIKAHTNLDSGDSAPGIERIAELVGCSHDTAQRALKTLMERELVQVRKVGRRNVYALTEKMEITEQDGEHYATAMRKYQPKRFKTFVEELERFAKTGNLPTDRAITFNVHVTVNNIQQGENGNVTIGDINNVKIEGSQQAISGDQLANMIRRRLKNIE